jgi:hypothetical protein
LGVFGGNAVVEAHRGEVNVSIAVQWLSLGVCILKFLFQTLWQHAER